LLNRVLKKDFSPLDIALHLNPGVPHSVLPWPGRDHPANFPGDPFTREIPAIYNDSRVTQCMGDSLHRKRPFQVIYLFSRRYH
jgi:hypothetical protein